MSHLKIDEFGIKRWYNDEGEYHREDGPAIVYRDYKQWWYNGKFIGDSINVFTQEKFERYLRSLKIKEYW